MNSIRTAQAPAAQNLSLREILTRYSDRTAPHTPDVGPSEANPLRAILDDKGEGGGAPGGGEGGGDAWRQLLMGAPEALADDGLLFELLSRLGGQRGI